MPQADKSFTEIDVRRAGMDLLARREHTRRELLEKLTRRFGSSDIIQSQVDRLSEEGLQSDERFVEAFVHYRQNSGKGPLRIIQELKQKGVNGALIEAYVDPRDDVWFDMAKSTLLKKFGAVNATSANEKAKRARFLQYRGFSSEMVFRLI